MSEARFGPGDVIADAFEVIEVLGASAAGVAYLVKDTEQQKQMVLKRVAIPYPGDEAFEALRDEVEKHAELKHKNLARLYGLAREDEEIFVAMEYLEGETLEQHLSERRGKGQTMTFKSAYGLVAHICNALQTVHEAGMIHGALTPRNVYVTKRGRIKVTNLVYSNLVRRHEGGTTDEIFMASPFIAPELKKEEDAKAEPAADIYSLALLTAEVLSEDALEDHEGDTEAFIEGVVAGRSAALQDLLFNATLPMPQLRQQSVKDFKAGLKEAVESPEKNAFEEAAAAVLSSQETPKVDPEAAAAAAAEEEAKEEEADDLPPPKNSGFPAPKSSGAFPAPKKKKDLFDIDLPDSPKRQTLDFGGAKELEMEGSSGGLGTSGEDEVWLVQKDDGLDYGPFGPTQVVKMLKADEIHEETPILHMITQKRANLIDVDEFHDIVVEYIPIREERKRKEEEERQRRVAQVKTASKWSGSLIAGGLIFVIVSAVLTYLALPDPVPVQLSQATPVDLPAFEVPVAEELAVNVPGDLNKQLFDPAASAEDRQAALDAWQEERRKEIEKKKAARRAKQRARKRRKRSASASTSSSGGGDEEIEAEINMGVGPDGEYIDPLEDWEIQEAVYTSSNINKITKCLDAEYSRKGRGVKTKVSFQIDPRSGAVRKIRVSGSGALEDCMRKIFRSLRFRESGGTPKKVSFPFEYG